MTSKSILDQKHKHYSPEDCLSVILRDAFRPLCVFPCEQRAVCLRIYSRERREWKFPLSFVRRGAEVKRFAHSLAKRSKLIGSCERSLNALSFHWKANQSIYLPTNKALTKMSKEVGMNEAIVHRT